MKGQGAKSSMIRKDFLIFGSPAIEEDEIEEVAATIRSGWLGTGPKVDKLAERSWRSGVPLSGPKLLNPDGSIQRSCWPFPMKVMLGNAFFLFQLGVLDDYRLWDHRYDRQVDCIAPSALLVRRELFETVGLLDERFFAYGAEVEWGRSPTLVARAVSLAPSYRS